MSIFSAASLDIPYGSMGSGRSLSLKGILISPYRAMEEQKTILFTLFCMAALNTAVDPATIFRLIRYGEKTERPS